MSAYAPIAARKRTSQSRRYVSKFDIKAIRGPRTVHFVFGKAYAIRASPGGVIMK